MADNITIPATGTGTATPLVATDEIQVSGTATLAHVQFVKLVDGTLNGTGAIGGDAANGLDVDVTRIPGQYVEDGIPAGGDIGLSVLAVRRDTPASSAGTDGDWATPGLDSLGRMWVAPNPRILTAITPTIDTALYATGDRLGSVMTFTGAALANGGAGKIVNAVLTSRDTEAPVIELWLFQVSPTMANADNGVFDLTDANLEAGILLGVIEFVSYYKTSAGEVSIGQMRGAALGGTPLPYKCGAAATSIYGIMCIRSASTYATTTDLIVTLTMDRE
jgi:hypothetical protein